MRHRVLPLVLVAAVTCARSPEQVTPSEDLFRRTCDCVTHVAAESGYGVSRLYPSQSNPDARLYSFVSLADEEPTLAVLVHGQLSGRVYVRLPYWGHDAPRATGSTGRRMAEATARTISHHCTPEGVPTIYTLDEIIERYEADGRVGDAGVAEELYVRLEELHRLATRRQHRAWSREEPLRRLAAFNDYVNAQSGEQIEPEAARELVFLVQLYYDYDLNTSEWTYGIPQPDAT